MSWSNLLHKLSNSDKKVAVVSGSSACAGAALAMALGAGDRDASCSALVLGVESPIKLAKLSLVCWSVAHPFCGHRGHDHCW